MNEEEEVYNGSESIKQEPLKRPFYQYGQPYPQNGQTMPGQQPMPGQNPYAGPQSQGNRPNMQFPQGNPQMTYNPQQGQMNPQQGQYTPQQGQYNPQQGQYTPQPQARYNAPSQAVLNQSPTSPAAPYGQLPPKVKEAKPDKQKKSKGLIIGIISGIVVLLAGLGVGMYFLFDKKEDGGASSIETIAYAYIDAYNSGNASNLKDYVSDDVKDKDTFVKNVESFITDHKNHISELQKSKVEIETGDMYSESDRVSELEAWDYEKDKSDEIRDMNISVKYIDKDGIENAGTYYCTITCMNVNGKWFIVNIKDIDIEPYKTGSNVDIPAGLSDDLFSKQICFEGDILELPFEYSKISDEFSYNLKDYGFDDDYVLNTGDVLPGTIALKSDNFDDDLDIWIGFTNDTDEKKKIADCKINSLDIDIGYTKNGKYPSLILPGGITWGSTADEIEAAYGEPPFDPFVSTSLNYTEYTYVDDAYTYYVELYVDDDKGITHISVACM